jgi:zinc transporter ZupT
MRVAGGWLTIAAVTLALALVFHGPPSPDMGVQMQLIADGSLRWSIVHWGAAVSLSSFAIAGLIALTAGSRLTQDWWTMSAWAVLPIGALMTVNTAISEATVIFEAAVTGNRAVFESWWGFAAGMGNGFAAMALAFTIIAANEGRQPHGTVFYWATRGATVLGVASFAGWGLGSWLGFSFGGPIWLVSSLLMCLWLAWFGFSLLRTEPSLAARQRDVPSRA